MLKAASNNHWGDRFPVAAVLLMALVGGSISGVIGIYIGGAWLKWTGSWFGGTASATEVRAAVAWSSVPRLAALLLWIPQLAFYGKEMFTSHAPRMASNPGLLYVSAIIAIVLAIWAYIVLLQCLAEVHRFSAWKALGATLLPALVLGGLCACLVALAGGYG